MEYTADRTTLTEKIKEEIAGAASRQYSDDGASLYDAIWPTSRDETVLSGFLDDSLRTLVSEFTLVNATQDTDGKITFDTPDMDSSMEETARDSLDRYLVLDVCRAWMGKVYSGLVQSYQDRAAAELMKARYSIYSRKKIART